MASNLAQFHSLVSQQTTNFDWEAEDFDIKQIYQHYALKVSTRPWI